MLPTLRKEKPMEPLDRILIDSCSQVIKEKLVSRDYRLEFSHGRPFISVAGNNRVVCIYDEQVTDKERDTHFINRAKDFFEVQTEKLKELAIRTIVKSESERRQELPENPEVSGQHNGTSVLVPDTDVLSHNQLQLLKIIHEHCENKLYFNHKLQAIMSLDHRYSYVPDRFGGLTSCGVSTPLTHFQKISAQWDEIASLKHWPADPSFTDQVVSQQSLPAPGRLEDVKSIEAVVDYVAGGNHRPLVIFDVDDTIITREVFEHGTTSLVPVASNTTDIMTRIRQKSPNAVIILLTQTNKYHTHRKLREAGVSKELFQDILCVADLGGNKYDAVVHYVKQVMQQKPDQVCFVDDQTNFLKMVEDACKHLRIHCNTFHFTGAQGAVQRVYASALGLSVEDYVQGNF